LIEANKNIDSIISRIRSCKKDRDEVIKKLYYNKALRSMILSMILNKGGKVEDFNSIFNTSIMQFIKTVVKNKDFKINKSVNGYILGISKYIWYAELRLNAKTRVEPVETFFSLASEITPESLVIDFDKKETINKLLVNLGKNCKEVLMYWANGYKMKEIAKLVGYKSEGMAKKKKHICFKELMIFLDKNPHLKSILR